MNPISKSKFLYSILKPYRHFALLIILCAMLASVFDGISIGLLVPLMSNLQQMEASDDLPKAFQWLAMQLNQYPESEQIAWAIAFVLAAILFKNVFIAVSMKLGYWLSSRLVADLRSRAMNLLMDVGIDYHYKSSAGDLIEKVVNNTGKVEFFLRMIIELCANVLTLAVLFVMLFLLSWQLTLLTGILGGAFVLFIFRYTKSFGHLGQKSALAGQALMSAIHQSLSGILLIKSSSKEAQQITLLDKAIEVNRETEYRRNFKVFSLNPVTDILASAAFAVLFMVAMMMYGMNTRLMLTEMLPFMYILLRIVPLVKYIHSQRGEIITRRPYVDRVYELLRRDNKPFIQDGSENFPGLRREIRFQSVSFDYHGGSKSILQDVDFTLPAGKTTAIVGDSGAGKSTIVSLLLRLYDPRSGEILIDETPLRNFQLAAYHRKVGIVSQDTFLFNDTVKFNITFGVDQMPPDDRMIAAAQKAGAHEFIQALPKGYDTVVGDRGVQLSGGQRQRLAIARAIIRDPDILILDEATSSLDTLTERRIHQAITELSLGRTVIIIAHRLSTIQDADQIIVLKEGRVAEIGDAKNLLAQKGEYFKLVNAL
ncbi:MAG: ABC transporter ATP-binding protein [Calditrichaeota bacterium]|nr:ABC transporter ATP-binding protein [Calditrichota bacterium]